MYPRVYYLTTHTELLNHNAIPVPIVRNIILQFISLDLILLLNPGDTPFPVAMNVMLEKSNQVPKLN